MKTTFQELDLVVGERASCVAGYPRKEKVTVECVKDFDAQDNAVDIINNSNNYIKVIHGTITTSHLICSNWTI